MSNTIILPETHSPNDLSLPYSTDSIAGKTVLITGGASGIGEELFWRYAKLGANVFICDLATSSGASIANAVRAVTGNKHHAFIPCDVTSWESQTALFKKALQLSPTGLLHTVIANAGIGDHSSIHELPASPHDPFPSPDTRVVDVNVKGLVYTCRLAANYFRLNPPSSSPPHLLLMGSMACFLDASAPMGLYCASKHAVLGYFKTLRLPSPAPTFRANLLCPYFVDTPITPAIAKLLLAGIEKTTKEQVADAALRAECGGYEGRVLVVAPKGAGGIMEVLRRDRKGEGLEPFSRRVAGVLVAQISVERWVKDVSAVVGLEKVIAAVVLFFVVLIARFVTA